MYHVICANIILIFDVHMCNMYDIMYDRIQGWYEIALHIYTQKGNHEKTSPFPLTANPHPSLAFSGTCVMGLRHLHHGALGDAESLPRPSGSCENLRRFQQRCRLMFMSRAFLEGNDNIFVDAYMFVSSSRSIGAVDRNSTVGTMV